MKNFYSIIKKIEFLSMLWESFMVFTLEYFQIQRLDLINPSSLEVNGSEIHFESKKILTMQVLHKLLKKSKIQDWEISTIFTGLIFITANLWIVNRFQLPWKIWESKTYQSVNVVACSFINEQCDTQFESVYTLYGKCLRFRPKWVISSMFKVTVEENTLPARIHLLYIVIKKIWSRHLDGKQLSPWLFHTTILIGRLDGIIY